jgi:hypothetical protein
MARTYRSKSFWLASAVAVALFLGIPTSAAAQSKNQGTWLAAAAQSPAGASTWGRLTLRDGVLTFASNRTEWQAPLSDIKRIAESSRADRTIEIETHSGETLFVSILGQQMVTESPRKAMQIIERAVREAPAARAVLAAAAGSGSSF